MPHIPGLRSPYALVGRHVYLGRMLDKIRLHAAGKLPADYVVNLGEPRAPLFDARCCRFFGLPYSAISARTLEGGADEEILAWIESQTRVPTDDECFVWNRFMTKIGWRDERQAMLQQRLAECGLQGQPIDTFFDMLDVDEGRQPDWTLRPINAVVVMGVSGCGKTLVGHTLARALGWDFLDGDDFHSASNVAKMRSGHPLDDDDRAPWLASLHARLNEQDRQGRGTVLGCSALRERYRTALMPNLGRIRYVHLCGDRTILEQRLGARPGHFMPASLLTSQLATLERPLYALEVDIALALEAQCAYIRRSLRL